MKIRNYLNRNFGKKRRGDLLSKERRSFLMSKIKSRETSFERQFVKELGRITHCKFMLNVNYIKGKPDVVFPKKKLCIFLDSNFWHGWQYPRWKHLLKNVFWRNKIEANRRRDKKTTRYLRNNGWTVLRFWEHNLKTRRELVLREIVFELNK